MKILALGEALIDVVDKDGEVSEHVGGSLLNVACGVARLGHDSTIAAWIGQDQRGDRLRQWAHASGATFAPGSDGAAQTPVAYATLDAVGRATYTFDLTWDVPDLDVGSYGHVHTGSIAATLEPGGTKVVDVVRRAAGTVSYDPNVRPALMGRPADVVARVEELVAASDLVKASDEDVHWLYPSRTMADIARRWLDLGTGLVVITKGPEGASVHLGSGESYDEPTLPVTIGDTVGAGDSFMAGLIGRLVDLGLLGGERSGERLRAATWDELRPAILQAIATSTITVSRQGAYAPTPDEVTELLQGLGV
ncbi:MAG: PfkB family carbohydrate kinase [Actinobacteria bacterium]|nr:PfkB family carbohydrate kinase [Actinomycetota bacterium]